MIIKKFISFNINKKVHIKFINYLDIFDQLRSFYFFGYFNNSIIKHFKNNENYNFIRNFYL